MRKQRFMDVSYLVCPVCGSTMPIMRSHGRHRERGHIKDFWCPFCKENQKFTEIRHGDYYVTETGKVIYM